MSTSSTSGAGITFDQCVTGALILGGAALAASVGSIGVVGGGLAFGLSALDLAVIGGGAGAVIDHSLKNSGSSASSAKKAQRSPATTPTPDRSAEQRRADQRMAELRKRYAFLNDEPQDIQDLRRGDF